MPCTCDGYPEPEPDLHNGPVAEMLCKSLQDHEARGEMGCFTKDQLTWWKEHKKRDRARVQQDLQEAKTLAAKKKALAKLSNYERELLNLKD